MRVSSGSLAAALAAILCLAAPAGAQGIEPGLAPTGYTTYGTPGLVELPTAESAPEGELAASLSLFGGTERGTVTFQVTDRLSGSFRYARIANGDVLGNDRFDRSFDLRYRVLDETRWRPAVAVGLNDFVGTGIYAGEYVVATKTLTPRLTGTVGIGWGRFAAGPDGFTNPLGVLEDRFETRPGRDGFGGEFELDRVFRGPAALFGGVSYRLRDDLLLKAEYSPDPYALERAANGFERGGPINVGLDWAVAPGIRAQASLLHGREAAVGLTFALNPRRPAVNGGRDPAPQAILPRAPGAADDLRWTAQPDGPAILQDNLRRALANDGIALEALRLGPRSATVLIRNLRYGAVPQAVGRTARVMTRTLPASIETFEVVPVTDGIPAVSVTLRRSDLEALENAPDASWRSYVRAEIGGGARARDGAVTTPGLYPRLTWSLGPSVDVSAFDPDSPLRADLGLRLAARWEPAPGLAFAGSVRGRAIGNRDDEDRPSDSPLPRVRSETFLYARPDIAVDRLYGSYQFRPSDRTFARVTAGHLERQFGGVAAELLWKPPEGRLALGVEVAYARQRDFEGLGFRGYDVVTGHASAYLRLANGFDAQLDVGRYLAGDTGATVRLERTFSNGWRLGAFATLTDVPFDDFGEGSFDKGLTLTIPFGHLTGNATARRSNLTLRPVLRDGGARLGVPDRLYGQVRDAQDPALRRSWGRFWR